jgi:leader peptidase (prepilin peptidase) / N-methyltransferase
MALDAVCAMGVLGVAGLVAGVLARRLLGGLRRGARVRAPVCEVGVGVGWVAAGGLWGAGALQSAWLPALLGLGWLGVAAGLVDLRHHRLPDALTLPAACAAPLAVLPLGGAALGRGLLGSVVAVLGYGAVHALRPAAMGLGDVKLAASLGVVLGAVSWGALGAAAALAALFTGVAALVGCAAPVARRVRARPAVSAFMRKCAGGEVASGSRRPGAEAVGGGPAAGSEVVPCHRLPIDAAAGGGLAAGGEVGARAAADGVRGVPHGPSMLAAAWLVTVSAAVGLP